MKGARANNALERINYECAKKIVHKSFPSERSFLSNLT
jgi:hypothetical protein